MLQALSGKAGVRSGFCAVFSRLAFAAHDRQCCYSSHQQQWQYAVTYRQIRVFIQFGTGICVPLVAVIIISVIIHCSTSTITQTAYVSRSVAD